MMAADRKQFTASACSILAPAPVFHPIIAASRLPHQQNPRYEAWGGKREAIMKRTTLFVLLALLLVPAVAPAMTGNKAGCMFLPPFAQICR